LVPSVTTTGQYNTVSFDVFAGDATLPVNNLYGLAFTLNYDATLLDNNSTSFSVNGSGLGTHNVDLITLNKPFFANGYNDIALVRTNQANVNGEIYLGSFTVRTALGIDSIELLTVSASNVHAIDANQNNIPLASLPATVTIDPTLPTGINTIEAAALFNFYPNPASDQFTVRTNGYIATRMILMNSFGQQVVTVQPNAEQTIFSTATLAEGVYFLSVETESGRSIKQVVVRH
jgi:hypothetical protein